MRFHVRVEPMPDNPARLSRIGDRSGHWRVVVTDLEEGRFVYKTVTREVHSEELPYHQAAMVAYQLQSELSVRKCLDRPSRSAALSY